MTISPFIANKVRGQNAYPNHQVERAIPSETGERMCPEVKARTHSQALVRLFDRIRILRYGLSGGIAAVVNYLMFIGLLRAGLKYLLAANIASLVTLVVSYMLNRNFVFSVRRRRSVGEVFRFLLGYLIQYVLAISGYWLLIGQLGLGPTVAFILNGGFVALVTYLFLKYLVFPAHKPGEA